MRILSLIKGLTIILAITLVCACATTGSNNCTNSMTDIDITTNVYTRIGGEKGLADNNIQVKTYERVVTLTGTVQNQTQMNVAIMLAKSVPHVKKVISKLRILNDYEYEKKNQFYD